MGCLHAEVVCVIQHTIASIPGLTYHDVMPLFEVAVLEIPNKKELEEGKTERLVFGPKPVVARDAQSAAITAVLAGDKPDFDMAKAQVLVRPFA